MFQTYHNSKYVKTGMCINSTDLIVQSWGYFLPLKHCAVSDQSLTENYTYIYIYIYMLMKILRNCQYFSDEDTSSLKYK